MSSKDTCTGSVVAQRGSVKSSHDWGIKWEMDNNGNLKCDI